MAEPEFRGTLRAAGGSHWSWRENQAMARRLKKSKLDAEPCVEDIDYRIHAAWTGSSCAAWSAPSGWPNIFPSC